MADPQSTGAAAGKLVIRNIGLMLSGDLDHPILEADTLVAIDGRIAGLGKASAHLRQLRFRGADCYAQPSTVAGREIMRATGFAPVPSFQPDLWCYERPWHRQPMRMPGAIVQARSFADARH